MEIYLLNVMLNRTEKSIILQENLTGNTLSDDEPKSMPFSTLATQSLWFSVLI